MNETTRKFRVLGIRRLPDTDPQEFELRLHDSENKKDGYVMNTEYGTESELRSMLKNGGIQEPAIDSLFKQAARP
jgi:hypothetical protein